MTKASAFRQVAALPYRRTTAGDVEILLVTSRERGRWILPKGWPIKGLSKAEAAAVEAREEAGAVGRPASEAVGSFETEKRSARRLDRVTVTVYPLAVDEMLEAFPEKGQRLLRWMSPEEAAATVTDAGAAAIILRFAAAERAAAA